MTGARRRVLQICEPTHAGAARVTFHLATGLRAHGFDSTVCTPSGELAQWCAVDGVPVLALPFTRRAPGTYPRAAAVVARAMRSDRWALVHAHSSFSGVLARTLRRHGGPPVVFQPHAWSFQALAGASRTAAVAVERALAPRTDLLVCVSEDEQALGEAAGLHPRATVVVDNGVDFDRALPRREAPPPSDPVLGAVVRFTPQKGVDILLRAVAEPAWPAGARVEIAGDGPLQGELTTLAATLGVTDRVRFLGRLPDVGACLARWDLFVSPARYEGSSLAVLEAIAADLPIVCTDVAGVRDLTDPRRPAVPIDDSAALAAAVATALTDWPTTRAVARAVRDRARARHSLQAQAAAMAAAYATLR